MAAILCVITPIHIDSNPIEFTVLKIKPMKIFTKITNITLLCPGNSGHPSTVQQCTDDRLAISQKYWVYWSSLYTKLVNYIGFRVDFESVTV